MRIRLVFALLASLCATFPATVFAAPYVHAPQTCEFTITFPEKPHSETKCSAQSEACAEVVTFAKVPHIGASINFRVSCLPLTEKDVATYTPEVMKQTLSRMLEEAHLPPYSLEAEEKDGVKRASSVSLGTRNGQDVMYTGQIWVGRHSMLTVEGEMQGPQNDTLDRIFAEILKSLRARPGAAKAKTENTEKTEENPPSTP